MTTETKKAFEKAITDGRLSSDPTDSNYVGNYMYMGNYNGKDTFKDSLTRRYIV